MRSMRNDGCNQQTSYYTLETSIGEMERQTQPSSVLLCIKPDFLNPPIPRVYTIALRQINHRTKTDIGKDFGSKIQRRRRWYFF